MECVVVGFLLRYYNFKDSILQFSFYAFSLGIAKINSSLHRTVASFPVDVVFLVFLDILLPLSRYSKPAIVLQLKVNFLLGNTGKLSFDTILPFVFLDIQLKG